MRGRLGIGTEGVLDHGHHEHFPILAAQPAENRASSGIRGRSRWHARGRDAVLTRLRRLPWWIVLGALVLLSTGLRVWASRGVATPWIAPDEQIYGLLGQGLYRDGGLTILG